MVTRRKKRKSKTLKRKRKKSNHFIIRARRNKTFRGGWLFGSPRLGNGYDGMRDIKNDNDIISPANVMRGRITDEEREADELRKTIILSRYTSNRDLEKQEYIVEKVKEIMDEARNIIKKLEELLGKSEFVSNQNVRITDYNELIRNIKKDSLIVLQSNKPKTRLSKIRTYFVGNDIDDRLTANTLQLSNLKQKIQYFYNFNFQAFHNLLQSLNKYFQDNGIDNRSLFWILLKLNKPDSDLYMNLIDQNKSISARITYKDFIRTLLDIAKKIENMFDSNSYSLVLNESELKNFLEEFNLNEFNNNYIESYVSPMFSNFLMLFDYYNKLYRMYITHLTEETEFILPPY